MPSTAAMSIDVFVSYCHADADADAARLRVFIDALRDVSNGAYQIVVDYQHQGAAIGANLSHFMQRVHTADVVIILLTPLYRKRVAERSGSGVYEEFRRIYDRLLRAEQDQSYEARFLLLPIIFAGSFADSCPEELKHLVCGTLTWLYVDTLSKAAAVHPALSTRLQEFAADLADRISAVAATRDSAYRSRQTELFKTFLSDDTRFAWESRENQSRIERMFIETSAFRRLRNHEASFVVGRKGSGKSLIVHVVPLLSVPTPAIIARIDVEHLPLELCFNVARRRRAESELVTVLPALYEFLWDAFLHLLLAWKLRDRLPDRCTLRRYLFADLVDEDEDRESDEAAVRVLFAHVFEQLVSVGDEMAAMSSPGAMEKFRERILGDTSDALYAALAEIATENGRVLVTVDGFDVRTTYFVRGSGSPLAGQFEGAILAALGRVVLRTRT